MSKYQMLVNILDKIREETTDKSLKKYKPDVADVEAVNQARARAYIHLYLKVKFGLLKFDERERQITDGSYDGGIDGYYVDKINKTIHFIQSKFRTTDKNFEEKEISLEEILVMDVDRITKGEDRDESGNEYNGKIKQLQRDLSEIEDMPRYTTKITLLANVRRPESAAMKRAIGGYLCEVIDHEECYRKLVFPVLSGTFFNASDLSISIDLSNKNSGSRISYTVQTKTSECEITVLFVPIIEIARLMDRYRNSVLRFNPRSYLDLEGKKVNTAIRSTVIDVKTNEFALFNNGITILSDETSISERIGQKNKAQLRLKNPQVINGGQTCHTLSRILGEVGEPAAVELFLEKEVLLKVITLAEKSEESSKLELIESISTATNLQTPVIGPDRLSNNTIHLRLQSVLFERYGLLYERKRGEFADGVLGGYVLPERILERNLFFRIYYAALGEVAKARGKKPFAKQEFTEKTSQISPSWTSFSGAGNHFRRSVASMMMEK